MKIMRHVFFVLTSALILTLFLAVQAQAKLEYVEIQWAICENSAEGLRQKLGYGIEDESSYAISYFDSSDLMLKANGVSARVTQKTNDSKSKYKSKIKIEFKDAAEIDWKWLENYDSKCEYDQYGLNLLPRCAIQNKPVQNGSMWSREQRDFLQKFKPGISLSNLVQWGPFQGRELTLSVNSDLSTTVTELTVGRRPVALIELSVRVPVDAATTTYQHFSTFFQQRGVHLCDVQQGMFERLLSTR